MTRSAWELSRGGLVRTLRVATSTTWWRPSPPPCSTTTRCCVLYCTVLYCTVLCQVEDAVTVLRQSLAEAEDGSLVIASIGFLHNLLSLLQSPGDSISPASGYELVRDKVDTTR